MQSSERGGGSGSMLKTVSVGFSSRYVCLRMMLRFLVRNRRVRVTRISIGKYFFHFSDGMKVLGVSLVWFRSRRYVVSNAPSRGT